MFVITTTKQIICTREPDGLKQRCSHCGLEIFPKSFLCYELLPVIYTDIDLIACIYAKKYLNKVTKFSKEYPGHSVKKRRDGIEGQNCFEIWSHTFFKINNNKPYWFMP
jgi:hypothetical protein